MTKKIVASLALTLCLCAPAFADAPTPTLDTLKGQPIPDTDPVQYYPESGYKYEEIQNADPENLPTNAVTIYEKQEVIKYYDPTTGKEVAEADRLPDVEYKEVTTYTTTPKYYTVDLKQTEYGHTDKYDSTQDFTITTPNSDKTGNAFEYAIKYYVDSTRLQPDRITTDQNGADIDKDFVGLNIESSTSYARGGAISNAGNAEIGDITGDFIGNYATGSSRAYGGAIDNSGDIGNITGDFTGNYATARRADAYGGAIDNSETIADITGDFIGNYASSESGNSRGGAIDNTGKIEDITGDFIGNYVTSSDGSAIGGAIYHHNNSGDLAIEIGDIAGDFIGNYASSAGEQSLGGAIANFRAKNGDITGDFIGNYASSSGEQSLGGAIYNSDGTIGDITGDFIGNYASSSGSYASGGAIYNYGEIGDITGDFIGNYTYSSSSGVSGGAISNNFTIGDIMADFIGNYASSTDGSASGGAIYNYDGAIENITGNFIGNYASSTDGSAEGGAISNKDRSYRTIGNITGDFIGNYATGSSHAYGGAIYNNHSQIIRDILGDFIGNYARSTEGSAEGGALNNEGAIGNITGDFIGNYVKSENSYAIGGAISNWGLIGTVKEDTNEIIYGEIKNSSFINNYAESKTGNAAGGAIFSTNHINITADNGQSIFSGNKTISNGKEEQNAIGMYGLHVSDDFASFLGLEKGGYLDSGVVEKNPALLTLEAKNNGVIQFDDTIRGGAMDYEEYTNNNLELIETPETAFDLQLTGDSTGTIYLNNDIINANISVDNTNVYVKEGSNLAQSPSLAVNSGVLNIIQLDNQTINFNNFSNSSQINLASVDVDLANESMGRISADNYGDTTGSINVQHLNLLSDATKDKTSIEFADKEIANNVQYTGSSSVAYSPIYKYEVGYDPNTGMFTFVRGGGAPSGSYDNFNPSVVAPSVATQAGAYTTQLQTFNYAFQHADTFMNIPYLDRLAIINQNKYALSPTSDATDVGTFSPLMTKQEVPGFWIKPYASFENIPLKNGPKVSNINYGTLVGYDSPITSVGRGWERVLTGYIGYNGASQRYSGVDTYQNGGILGGTTTFYKGNFFNATTLSVGASSGSSTNMYGNENYAMLLAGIGNKTGYNFEFKEGRIILQPSFLISYTFVNTFDYTNSAGLRIESDPLHAIQLAPGIKVIGNLPNGWQPYIGVNMIWNLLQTTKVTANDVRLPEMSIKPYVQYGVGLQRLINDRFMAYGQAMIHNGGRNGISLSAGFRWKVGKE